MVRWTPVAITLAVRAIHYVDGCSTDKDCNADLCLDCKCSSGGCSCADGWSGSTCQTPFCTNSSQCNNHGNCTMTLHSITCSCDVDHSGGRCETVECRLPCIHGGQPNSDCTTCEGCYPGWSGSQCDQFSKVTNTSQLLQQYQGLRLFAVKQCVYLSSSIC